MKLTINKLRRIIREQIGRMYTIDNAGFGGGAGISTLRKDKDLPPPGLGDEGEQEKEKYGEEQEEFQWTVSARERKDGERR